MNFIRAWQSLPEYGVSLFVVKFHGEKKEELLVRPLTSNALSPVQCTGMHEMQSGHNVLLVILEMRCSKNVELAAMSPRVYLALGLN